MTEEERRRKCKHFKDFFTGKELEDARREDLTVLIADLSLKATEKDIWEFFTRVGEICIYDAYQHAGKVSDIQLIKDGRSGKSKGLGYVEFHDAESVLKALNLTGQCILSENSPPIYTFVLQTNLYECRHHKVRRIGLLALRNSR